MFMCGVCYDMGVLQLIGLEDTGLQQVIQTAAKLLGEPVCYE